MGSMWMPWIREGVDPKYAVEELMILSFRWREVVRWCRVLEMIMEVNGAWRKGMLRFKVGRKIVQADVLV